MLQGKVAVVTGAGRGIGRAIALKLAAEGAKVVVNYCGSQAKAEEVTELIKADGGEAIAIKADMSDAEAVKQLFDETIRQFGRIDILVNNAGITRDNLILKMTDDEYNEVIDTNLRGVYYCLKQVSKIMLKQKSGRIINISSISGVIGNAGQVNYCAAKAGVIGMTKALARELGSRGITVNAVAPGFIKTDMTDVLSDTVKENLLSQIPLKRLGEPEEIADAVVFLASDKAAYITGQTIQVNGGMGM